MIAIFSGGGATCLSSPLKLFEGIFNFIGYSEKLFVRHRKCTNYLTGITKKSAFTLAEVLITLGIIGIVAAMTLPSLTEKTKYKELETRYKVASNLLHNVVNYFHAKEVMIYGTTYCTAGQNCKGQAPIFTEVLAEGFSGIHALNKYNGQFASNKYYNFSNTTKFNPQSLDDGYMELKNGMSVIVESGNLNMVPIIYFDINGTGTNPNRMGYDVFAFVIDKEDRVCPLGAKACNHYRQFIESADDFTSSNYCNPSSSDAQNGITCGYFAVNDSNYFRKIMKKQK